MVLQKVLIICGPTATGKTALAVALAKTFQGELVNADSRQVYKGLDALTGKDRCASVPIHLYDLVEPEEEFTQPQRRGAGFSVAHFVSLANAAIADIGKRKRLPIVVGGTGFYLKALTESIDTILIPPNWSLRKQLALLSVNELQKLVKRERLKRMNESDRKNPRRLIRAVEVAGRATSQKAPRYDALWIGLTAPLAILKKRIAQRIAKRFDDAVLEVRPGLPPVLGSEALLAFGRGELAREEALAKWIQAEYGYAKRQMTWFNKEKQIHWFDASKDYMPVVEARVREWYTGRV